MSRGIGLDFGTTNSALAVVGSLGMDRSGIDRSSSSAASVGVDDVTVVEFATASGPTPSFRSVVFFGRERDDGPLISEAGPRAIERYLDLDEHRRLMQSLKSFLASRLFQATSVFGKTFTLEDLIGHIVAPLRREAEAGVGELRPPLVVGRPVRFANAEGPDDEARALSRLSAALWQAGFPDVRFEYEPVAAAHHYESGLEHDELVMIADFGGGTSDFSLMHVGPSLRGRARRPEDIIGNAGVAVAGDAFDARIVRHVVAERLGRGSMRQVFMGKQVEMPNWIYRDLERWHHLSFLRSRKTMGFLHEALYGAVEPEKIAALIHVIDEDLGYSLYRAVQATKLELSRSDVSTFLFEDPPVRIEENVRREDFESWIAEELDAIAACVDGLLEETGTAAQEVDRVFMTGGSAFVPAVRQLFSERFGVERLTGGGELISVASGLALRARDLAAEED